MTLRDALRRARDLYGNRAVVAELTVAGSAGIVFRKQVGHTGDAWAWRVTGEGPTWEAALEAARQHEGKVPA